jgi:hypothetical protein
MSGETFWLTATNISLGVIAVASLMLFVKVILQEVLIHARACSSLGSARDGTERLSRTHSPERAGKAGQ